MERKETLKALGGTGHTRMKMYILYEKEEKKNLLLERIERVSERFIN